MDIDLFVISTGFNYKSDKQEIQALENGCRVTTSYDMVEVQSSASVTRGAGSITEFTDVLLQTLSKPDDRLRSLGIIGHSNGTTFAFSGSINPNNGYISFRGRQQLTNDTLTNIVRQRISGIKSQIPSTAAITLYGCHSAGNQQSTGNLLQAIVNTFGITAAGFTRPLETCVKVNSKRTEIIERGWIRVVEKPRPDTPKLTSVSCEKQGFTKRVDDLYPDVQISP